MAYIVEIFIKGQGRCINKMVIIEGIKDNIIKAYNYYNYFIGNSDSILSFERKATSSDMPSFLPKKIVDDGKVTYLGKDTINGFVKFSFNTADATDEMKNLINPDNKNNKNNLFKYITDYSDGTVTMIVPMDGYDHKNIKDKLKDKVGTFMKSENVQINESVSWGYFDKYDPIMDEYLPASGEGETMASQIVTAIAKLVYKWYNDGDVFDNTHYLEGWANDLSSYANWLYMNVPKCNLILDTIENIKTEGEYEDLLQKLTDYCFSDEVLNKFKDKEKKGSIYSAVGPYSFKDYEDEDEDWDDDEDEDEEWDESLTLNKLPDENELELKESDIDLSDFYSEGDWSSELDDYYDLADSEAAWHNDYEDEDYDDEIYAGNANGIGTDEEEYNESVMVPTPTPYKRNKKELELKLKESSNGVNYRVKYHNKDTNDLSEVIITADSAEDAFNKFKKENFDEIVEITNDSFTNSKTYYKQGWKKIREEELELKESIKETPLSLALMSYETGHWLDPEYFSNSNKYTEYQSYFDMGPSGFYKEFKDQLDFSPEFISEYGSKLSENTLNDNDTEVIKVINDVYKEKGDVDSDESIAEIEKRVKQKGITMDADSLGDILIKSAEMIDTLGESLSNKDANKLEKELRAKIKEVFLSKFGFEEDDWNEYSYLKITNPFINSEGDKGTKIEVRAEVDYNDLMYLARELDKIITKYDRDAYFEPVEPGIMVAYIWDGYDLGESLTEGLLDSVTYIDLDNAEATENPEEYVEYLINHELKLDKAKGAFKTAIKPIFFKAIKYLNTFKDIISNFQQRGNVFYIDYKRPVTEGKKVSFKDHHICQGCGNPLSKCTCEIEGLDFSGGTQVSNIGQHKVDELDMIEDEE